MSTVAQLFVDSTVRRFRQEYLVRLRQLQPALSAELLWHRQHSGENSIGNLLLHLEGNVRQWILSGVGGEPDRRHRAAEFDADGDDFEGDAARLVDTLVETVERACDIIATLDEESLCSQRSLQGFQVDTVEAIYHVLEHFSWHLGQITSMVKRGVGPAHGIAFYDEDRINRARNSE